MKSFEKETIQAQLKDEDKCLKDLEKAYKQAKKDCQQKLRNLNSRKDMHNLQSIIHQKKYQEALLKQIDGVLNDLQTHTYKTANDFFQGSYQNGYIGSMYELQKQGIPMTIPVSTKKIVTAIQTKSKLSQSYYEKQGLTIQNIRTLKKQIALEATRGIASGKSWLTVADSLTIQRYFDISQSDAMRIVRTEGNRINQQARLDAGDEAVQNGCDLLKQWDATLDSVTRPAHREADGQIVEWNEKFTVMGEKLDAPSIGGSASNVINCRCQLLKRPRWSLDEEELEVLKQRASYYGLDKTKSFEDYKDKFLKIPEKTKSIDLSERRKQRLAERRRQQEEKKVFVPAQDIKEVKRRISEALGVDEAVVNLGRMKLELANEYLDGIETFMDAFPQMKGLYTAINTKRCSGGVLGINAIEGKGRYIGKNIFYDCVFELGLKSPRDLDDLRKTYEYAVFSAQQYKGASPKATAIHELVHGLTHAIEMKKNGYFVNGVLQTTIPKREWDKYAKTGTWTMVNAVKDELYGMRHGREVFDGMMHLGSYAMTNSDETVAQAVSYEIINPTESKPFSAKIFEVLKKEVGETFK